VCLELAKGGGILIRDSRGLPDNQPHEWLQKPKQLPSSLT
jgi:hypothetical protein